MQANFKYTFLGREDRQTW